MGSNGQLRREGGALTAPSATRPASWAAHSQGSEVTNQKYRPALPTSSFILQPAKHEAQKRISEKSKADGTKYH